jgi:twitching motility protein PilT
MRNLHPMQVAEARVAAQARHVDEAETTSKELPPDASEDSISSVVEHARIVAPPSAQSGGLGALEEVLTLARSASASDVLIASARPVMMRLAGELVQRTGQVDPALVERMVREIVPRRASHALDADGSCDFALEHPTRGRFRVNVSKQRTGFVLALRAIPDDVPQFAVLGLPDALASVAHHHQGLVLIAGPPGHGKTTTLAALVDVINRSTAAHVVTVEDPIEFVHKRKKALMSQREVGVHTRGVAAALRAALREDPDVVVVGELTDVETVRLAIAAADTGHLVLATMAAPTAGRAIELLIDMFAPAEQMQMRLRVASHLRLAIAQRLVPSADRKMLFLAVEVLPGSVTVYSAIREGKTAVLGTSARRPSGMVRLDESLADLVRSGKTTTEIARAYADQPGDLDAHASIRPPPAQPAQRERKKPADDAMDLGGLLSRSGSLFGKRG